jgi:hypothetical protein|nr:MAG TPA: hypothetical protein [Caudoviricetes sp.]
MDLILYLLGYQPTQYGIAIWTHDRFEAEFVQRYCGGEIVKIATSYGLEYKTDTKYSTQIPMEVLREKIGDKELLFWYKYSMQFRNRPLGKKSKVLRIQPILSKETYLNIAQRIGEILGRTGIKIDYKKNQIKLYYLAFEEIRIRAGEIQEGEDYERS